MKTVIDLDNFKQEGTSSKDSAIVARYVQKFKEMFIEEISKNHQIGPEDEHSILQQVIVLSKAQIDKTFYECMNS